MLLRAKWLQEEMEKLGWPVWRKPKSNTVYFKRPPEAIVRKYDLTPDHDNRLGGDLSHIVVMQHVTKERLEEFMADLTKAIQ